MNTKKWRGWCTNCRRNEIKVHATKYCSLRCQHDYQFKARVVQLENGGYQVRGTTNPKFLKRYLILRQGERCQCCGWAQRHAKTGKAPIEIEHIDGMWENNRFDNLTLLCPNCHSLTPTFRGLNRGRGRAHRRGGRNNPLGSEQPFVVRRREQAPPIEKQWDPQLQLL